MCPSRLGAPDGASHWRDITGSQRADGHTVAGQRKRRGRRMDLENGDSEGEVRITSPVLKQNAGERV